ncbi:hypothetical protein BA190_08855 [Labrys sp. WJW]|uniref:helix-turn-helix transcriptional regulator n=1 Tax=Labrys sp. WJW TaxID=1737983 RepID=UPI000829F844|nr:AraC family transcriptional regulator [Labrys sp. WJW]OCC05505.1 hypothetical protein BA190_08855 [Labrys sp. WJW]
MSAVSSRRGQATGGELKAIRVRDFLERERVALDSPDSRLSMDDILIEGEFMHRELRPGLFLHGGDVVEEHAFTVTSHLQPGLSCIFFVDGEVGLGIGDRRFEFRGGPRGAMEGVAIMSTTAEIFRRISRERQHVRHLVVSASPEWLQVEGLEAAHGEGFVGGLLKDHLGEHRWTLTPRLAELVRQVMTPTAFAPELRNLYLEGRAVEIVAETIAAATQTDRRRPVGSTLARQDLVRLKRAKDLIDGHLAEPLSIEAIAREAGVCASGLQRLFRLSEGHSVFDYVRRIRLEHAHIALLSGEKSVQEASELAGYASPANFATAFRRQFGLAPRDVLAKRRAH